MPRIELTKTIRAPRGYAFSVMANTEDLPKVFKSYKSVKLVRKEGDVDIIEAEVDAMGWTSIWKIRRRYFPNERIEEGVDNDRAVGKATLTFSDVPEGTNLTLIDYATFKGTVGKLFGGLAKGRLEKYIDEDLESYKSYVEANKPS
jgi:uncharacterized membrane protein